MCPDRPCATCGKPETAHYARGPGALALGHMFAVRPGDDWCDECEDWVVNGCGTTDDCEERARDEARERAAAFVGAR